MCGKFKYSDDFIREVHSQVFEQGLTLANASCMYNIGRTTLCKRFKKLNLRSPREIKREENNQYTVPETLRNIETLNAGAALQRAWV